MGFSCGLVAGCPRDFYLDFEMGEKERVFLLRCTPPLKKLVSCISCIVKGTTSNVLYIHAAPEYDTQMI